MSRRLWIILCLVLIAVMIVCAAVLGMTVLLPRYRTYRHHQLAEEAYADEKWHASKRYFALYIVRHADDLDALSKYAEASLRLMDNRRLALRDAGRAYFQIALRGPEDIQLENEILEFYETHRFWGDLEYAADHFLRRRAEPKIRYYRALAMDRQGRSSDAIAAYRELVEQGATPMGQHGNLARLLRAEGLKESALSELESALEQYPGSLEIRVERAWYFLEANEFEQAGADIEAALDLDGEDPKALMVAVQHALVSGEFEAAAALLEKVLATDDANVEALVRLVYAYEHMGNLEQALALLDGADLVVRADNPGLFLALAELQITTGRYDEARNTAAAYRTAYPEFLDIFKYLEARELLVTGYATEAAEILITVVESNPEFVRAQYYQAVAYLTANQSDKARGALDRYLRSRPDDGRARALFKQAFGGLPTASEAEAEAKSALANDEASADSMIRAAATLIQSEGSDETFQPDLDIAKQLLERAINKEPDSPRAYRLLVEYLVRRGLADEALAVLDRAASAGVGKRALASARAAVCLSRGEFEAAKSVYDEVLGLGGLDRTEALDWAVLFASQNSVDAGVEALALAVQHVDESERKLLETDAIALRLQYDSADAALEALRTLEEQMADEPAVLDRLDELKLALAQTLLREERRMDEVEKLALEVERRTPGNAQARLLRAIKLLRGDAPDYAGARALADAVLAQEPANAAAWLVLYDVDTRLGRPIRALGHARKAADVAPTNVQAQLARAEAEWRMNNLEEARESVERVLDVSPNNFRALEILVRTSVAARETARAEAALARLAALAADGPEKRDTLARLRGWYDMQRGDLTRSEAELRALYEANPEDSMAVQLLARAVSGQGRVEEAAQLLRDYAAERPGDAEAWMGLGRFYLSLGNPTGLAEASSAFTQALFIREDYAPALRGLIDVQLRRNNVGAVLGLTGRYLALEPGDADMFYRRAFLLAQTSNRPEQILEGVEKAIAIVERPEFLYLRATAHLALGHYQEALDDLRKVAQTPTLALNPAELDISMAEAYLGLGDYVLARHFHESAKSKSANADTALRDRLESVEQGLEEERGSE